MLRIILIILFILLLISLIKKICFKKEKYDNLQVDYIPAYTFDYLFSMSSQTGYTGYKGYTGPVPAYNSQIFCDKFNSYTGCREITISPTVFGMSLLSALYNPSIVEAIQSDYPYINYNNAVGVSNMNRNDIVPFIPYTNFVIDTSSLTNTLSFLAGSNNNLAYYDTIINLYSKTQAESALFEILETLNNAIISYMGDSDGNSEYINYKKYFINNSENLDINSEYTQGGDPDLLCSYLDEYGANKDNLNADSPISSGLYFIKSLDSTPSGLFWDNTSTTTTKLTSNVNYFYFKYNPADSTYTIFNKDNYCLYYSDSNLLFSPISSSLLSISSSKFKITYNDTYKIYETQAGSLINFAGITQNKGFLIGTINNALYNNLPKNINNIACNNEKTIGKWFVSSDDCRSACLGITKSKTSEGIKVGTCSDNTTKSLCSCCSFEDGYTARTFLTNWINSKIDVLKNILKSINDSTLWNAYDNIDPQRCRLINIYFITMALIVNLYQEKTLVDNSNVNGTYYKPWENMAVINEMRNFILKYLPTLRDMVNSFYVLVLKSMTIAFTIPTIQATDLVSVRNITCNLQYSINYNGEKIQSNSEQYTITYYPIIDDASLRSSYNLLQADAFKQEGYKKWNWFSQLFVPINQTGTTTLSYSANIKLSNIDYTDDLIKNVLDIKFNGKQSDYPLYSGDLENYYSNTLFFLGTGYVKGDKLPRDSTTGIYNNLVNFVNRFFDGNDPRMIVNAFKNIGGISLDDSNSLLDGPDFTNTIIDSSYNIYPFGVNAPSWGAIVYDAKGFSYNCTEVISATGANLPSCVSSTGQTFADYKNISSLVNSSYTGSNFCCPIDSSGNVNIQTCHDPDKDFKNNNRKTYCVSNMTGPGPNILSNTLNDYNCTLSSVDYLSRYPNVNLLNNYIVPYSGIYFINIVNTNKFLCVYPPSSDMNYLFATEYQNILQNYYCNFTPCIAFNENTKTSSNQLFVIGCNNFLAPGTLDIQNSYTGFTGSNITYGGFLQYSPTDGKIYISEDYTQISQASNNVNCFFNINLLNDGSYIIAINNSNNLFLSINSSGLTVASNTPTKFNFMDTGLGTSSGKTMTAFDHYNKVGKFIGYTWNGDLCKKTISIDKANLSLTLYDTLYIYKPSIYETLKTFNIGNFVYMISRSTSGICCNIYNISSKSWTSNTCESGMNATNVWNDTNSFTSAGYYSTIDGFVYNNNIYMYSRTQNGFSLKYFDAANTNSWYPSVSNSTQTLNIFNSAWNNSEYYSSIKAINIGDKLFIISRSSTGLSVNVCNIVKPSLSSYGDLTSIGTYNEPSSGPYSPAQITPTAWTDANGWNQFPRFYTIKYVNIGAIIYFIGMGIGGLEIKYFDTIRLQYNVNLPIGPLFDTSFTYYPTMNVNVVQNLIYISYKSSSGINMYAFDITINQWLINPNIFPLSDDYGSYVYPSGETVVLANGNTYTRMLSSIKTSLFGSYIYFMIVNNKLSGSYYNPTYIYYDTVYNSWNVDETRSDFTNYPNWDAYSSNIENVATMQITPLISQNSLFTCMRTSTGNIESDVLKINNIICGPGSSPNVLQNSCVQCPTGSYSTNGIFCTLCPQNTYSTTLGATNASSCIGCPLNTFSSPGSNSLASCTAQGNGNLIQLPLKTSTTSSGITTTPNIGTNSATCTLIGNPVVNFNGLLLNGSAQYATLSSFSLPTTVSFSCWVSSNSNGNYARIFEFGILTGDNNIVMFILNNNLGLALQPNIINNAYSTNMNNNTLNHIVWIIDNNIWSLYINGINIPLSFSTQSVITNISRNMNYIGKSNSQYDPYFNGTIADFRVYNRVLSISEIHNLYNNYF